MNIYSVSDSHSTYKPARMIPIRALIYKYRNIFYHFQEPLEILTEMMCSPWGAHSMVNLSNSIFKFEQLLALER